MFTDGRTDDGLTPGPSLFTPNLSVEDKKEVVYMTTGQLVNEACWPSR